MGRALRIGAEPEVDTTITDFLNHPPATSGEFNYNNFTPPTLGNTYVDPVFGKTVRRLTNIGNRQSEDPNYTFHIANCDGTLFLHDSPTLGCSIKSTTTGLDVYTPAETPISSVNAEYIRWSHTEPLVYFFLDGADLKKRDQATLTTTTLHTFPANLQKVGGSHEWADRTDRYFVVMYSNTIKVWDRTEDVIYANPFAPLPAVDNCTTTISPDGKYVYTWASSDAEPDKLHYSYALDHAGNSIAASPVQFWGIGGSHMVPVSASDGKNYMICPESYATAGVWRVDVTISAAGKTDAQQRAQAFQLLELTFADDLHFTAPTTGDYTDWCLISTEASDDDFDQAVGAWRFAKQELICINVLTGDIRRLVHHRSRNLPDGYYPQPKPSGSSDGSVIIFSSNMNLNQATSGYCDLYGIADPFSSL